MQNFQYIQRPVIVAPETNQRTYEEAQSTQRVGAYPQQIVYQYPSIYQQEETRTKKPKQWRSICLILITVAVIYINLTCFNVESTLAARKHQMLTIHQSVARMQAQLSTIEESNQARTRDSAPPRFLKKKSFCNKDKQRTTKMHSNASPFFDLQASSDPGLTCNGTSFCAALSTLQAQNTQVLQQISQTNATINNLNVVLAQHAQDIADLQNGTNPNNTVPNVTDWRYNSTITATNYNFTQMIELIDGRLATASISNYGGSSVLLWDLTNNRMSRNLTILYSPNILQSITQLHDGRLLATAKNPNTNAGELQVWNVTTGTIIQRIQFSYNLISILQLQSGNVVALTSQGSISTFAPNALYTPVNTTKVQTPIVSTNPNQLVEYFVGFVSKLLVIADQQSITQINTATWTVDQTNTIGGGFAQLFALYWSGNQFVTALGNTASNPLIVSLPDLTLNSTVNTAAFAAGLAAEGVLATTSSITSDIGLYNLNNGKFLRTLSGGASPNGYSIIPVHGTTINGFAVASLNFGTIDLFSY